MTVSGTLEERFWPHVIKTEGCWNWDRPRHGGYGRFQHGKRVKLTHVWAWEMTHGPVPEGLEIDHKCRNRACVRVDHLRAVTHRENTLAPGSLSMGRINRDKTRCSKRGHPYTPENTLRMPSDGGRRRCRACIREDSLAAYHRRRAEKVTL